jgi:hypothetical protein
LRETIDPRVAIGEQNARARNQNVEAAPRGGDLLESPLDLRLRCDVGRDPHHGRAGVAQLRGDRFDPRFIDVDEGDIAALFDQPPDGRFADA